MSLVHPHPEPVSPPDDIRYMHMSIAWLGYMHDQPRKPDEGKLLLAKNAMDIVLDLLGSVEVTSDQDREEMGKLASLSFEIARGLDDAIDKVNWSPGAKALLEELFYRIEDVAETAALAASKEFAEFIDSEIQGLIDGEAGKALRIA